MITAPDSPLGAAAPRVRAITPFTSSSSLAGVARQPPGSASSERPASIVASPLRSRHAPSGVRRAPRRTEASSGSENRSRSFEAFSTASRIAPDFRSHASGGLNPPPSRRRPSRVITPDTSANA